MKAKDLQSALKYFTPILHEKNLPSKVTEWRNDFNESEFIDFMELPKKDEEAKKGAIIVADGDALEYYDDFFAWGLGHARRGQHYYLLCHKETLEISVMASEPDGSGSAIEMPNELIDAILAGDIIHTQGLTTPA